MKREGPCTLRCRNPLVFNKVSTSSQKGAGTPANAVEHTQQRKKKFGSMSTIWRAEKPEAMLPAISSPFVTPVTKSTTMG